jgi:hypothetical protein
MRWTIGQRRRAYDQLTAINNGFDAARRALKGFLKLPGFERSEVESLGEIADEARAAALAYLANAIETVESDEAARLQNNRFKRERQR